MKDKRVEMETRRRILWAIPVGIHRRTGPAPRVGSGEGALWEVVHLPFDPAFVVNTIVLVGGLADLPSRAVSGAYRGLH